jgi:hypothetical protein
VLTIVSSQLTIAVESRDCPVQCPDQSLLIAAGRSQSDDVDVERASHSDVRELFAVSSRTPSRAVVRPNHSKRRHQRSVSERRIGLR